MSGRRPDKEMAMERDLTNLKEILGRVVYANGFEDYDARPDIYTDVFNLHSNLFETQEKRDLIRMLCEKRLQVLKTIEKDNSKEVLEFYSSSATQEDKDFLKWILTRVASVEEDDNTSFMSSASGDTVRVNVAPGDSGKKKTTNDMPLMTVERDAVFLVCATGLEQLMQRMTFRIKCCDMVSKNRVFLWEKLAVQAIIKYCPVVSTMHDIPSSLEEYLG
jgi:hypothetical protein